MSVNHSAIVRGADVNLDDIIFTLAVNFLLYVCLIIVFYMLVRFYLEEETSHDKYVKQSLGYAEVSTEENLEMEYTSTSINDVPDDESADKSLSPKSLKRQASFLSANDIADPEQTKQEAIAKIIFCGVGLNITFGIWGLVQERILTQTYDGQFFEYSYGLVFINRFLGLILSAYLMYYFEVVWVKSPLWEYSIPAVANMLSSWCQYEALKFVSFPTQMLFKAFKMLPVMLMGKFIHNKSYETFEYICAAVVGFGIYLFINSTEHINFSQNVFGDPSSVKGAWCGVVLLLLFLFFDSFTGQWQTRMFEIYGEMSPLQMMFITNSFSALFSFVTLIHQEEFSSSLEFVYNHPRMYLHLIVFCVCSTVGQLFIFYTVKNFGAVVFSIIMAIRILSSTLLSCFVYSHPMTELGFIGFLIVFGGLGYRIRQKTHGKPLIRWKEADEAKNILHEWHEHLDI